MVGGVGSGVFIEAIESPLDALEYFSGRDGEGASRRKLSMWRRFFGVISSIGTIMEASGRRQRRG